MEARRSVLYGLPIAIIAAAGILAMLILDLAGVEDGIGKVLLGGALPLGVSVPFLYMFVGRKVSLRISENAALARKAEEQELLSRIGTLALQDEGEEPMLRRVTEDVGRFLGVPRCAVRLFGNPDRTVEYRETGLSPADTVFSLMQTREYWRNACGSGKSVVIGDARDSLPFPAARDGMERIRVQALVGVPLCLGGEALGVLFLGRKEPHVWPESTLLSAQAVARQLAAAVGHAQVFREHREAADRLLSLTNNIPGMIYRGQRDWSMSFVNPEVERMTGYKPEEFMGGTVTWKDLIHPDDLQSVKLAFRNAVQCGKRVLRVEYRIRHRDGSTRWFADRRQLLYDKEIRFLYVDGICLDITERKRAEEREALRERLASP